MKCWTLSVDQKNHLELEHLLPLQSGPANPRWHWHDLWSLHLPPNFEHHPRSQRAETRSRPVSINAILRENHLTDVTIMTQKIFFTLALVIFTCAVITTRQVFGTCPKCKIELTSNMGVVSYLHLTVLTERRTILLLPEGSPSYRRWNIDYFHFCFWETGRSTYGRWSAIAKYWWNIFGRASNGMYVSKTDPEDPWNRIEPHRWAARLSLSSDRDVRATGRKWCS